MSYSVAQPLSRPLHPAHAFFLAAAFTPFLGAAISDYAYSKSFQIQWLNFSNWLIAGALVFGAVALLCASMDLTRAERRTGRASVYFLLVLAMWVLGLINAFVHAGDAWATMPMGLVLSVIVTLLAAAAVWIAFAGLRAGGAT